MVQRTPLPQPSLQGQYGFFLQSTVCSSLRWRELLELREEQAFNSSQHSESYKNAGEFITSKTLITSVLERRIQPDCS